MKNTTKAARVEIKKLIDTIGQANILGYHVVEIVEKTGCTYCDVQNAMNYFKFRKR